MRLAVEFTRYGPARYCSHLDMQRAAMRAVRRTDIVPEYSAGFNPHMLMSFASAMPVGLESDSEYFELRVLGDPDPADCLKALQKAMPEGIRPVWAGALKENAPKLMAALQFAGYEARFKTENPQNIKKTFANLLQSDMIETEIKKDGRTVKKDIRPLIREIRFLEDGKTAFMLLAASSVGTLNPEVLLKHVFGDSPDVGHAVKRTGLFTFRGGEIIPLRDLALVD